MAEPSQLSVNDRVLLHLSRFATDIPPEEYPPEATQSGIATAVGISRTHVPRAVKGLVRDGLVIEFTARVKGHERRMNVYGVTHEGLRKADGIWSGALDTVFSVLTEGKTVEMSGREIEELVGRRKAIAGVSQIRDGIVEIDKKRRAPVRNLGDAPSLAEFYGRDTELRAMDGFMDSESKILVVLGNKGFGTTALARRFVDEQEEADVLWVTLSSTTTARNIESAIIDFGQKVSNHAATTSDVLSLENVILVFDDYFSIGDDVVELFSSMVELVKDAKVVITARQETPAYNWFYHRRHVESGLVKELKLKGLDDESAGRLLGNDKIEKDALRRILMITHGQPMMLRMLRERDRKGLGKNTVFTAEEISYLLFLKDKMA